MTIEKKIEKLAIMIVELASNIDTLSGEPFDEIVDIAREVIGVDEAWVRIDDKIPEVGRLVVLKTKWDDCEYVTAKLNPDNMFESNWILSKTLISKDDIVAWKYEDEYYKHL